MKKMPGFLKKYIFTITKDSKQTKKLIKKIKDEIVHYILLLKEQDQNLIKLKKDFIL